MKNKPVTRLLLTPYEVAEAMAISERKLWQITQLGCVPVVRVGRCVRYRPADLAEWIERQTSESRRGH